jgi:glycerol-3-phosphate acyltransferase PlsX
MGGDFAPDEIIRGAKDASGRDLRVLLVGPEDLIRDRLDALGHINGNIEVRHASEVIEMQDHPVKAWKEKPDSSIRRCVELAASGEAQGCLTMGNTGAMMVSSLRTFERLPGVKRPGLAVPIPTVTGGNSVLLDAGSSVDCDAEDLFNFALLGSIFYQQVYGVERPRVGLVNVGEEPVKGSLVLKKAHRMLSEDSHINFKGNCEGGDVLSGDFDVVVADGLVGNVMLKLGEGVAKLIGSSIKKEILSDPLGILGGLLLRGAFRRFRKKFDWSEYGGSVMLGVNAITVIGHGKSQANAVKNAVRLAAEMDQTGCVTKIENCLKEIRKGE